MNSLTISEKLLIGKYFDNNWFWNPWTNLTVTTPETRKLEHHSVSVTSFRSFSSISYSWCCKRSCALCSKVFVNSEIHTYNLFFFEFTYKNIVYWVYFVCVIRKMNHKAALIEWILAYFRKYPDALFKFLFWQVVELWMYVRRFYHNLSEFTFQQNVSPLQNSFKILLMTKLSSKSFELLLILDKNGNWNLCIT